VGWNYENAHNSPIKLKAREREVCDWDVGDFSQGSLIPRIRRKGRGPWEGVRG